MINEKFIRNIVEENISGSDHYLVDVVIRSGNKIMVLLDGDNGVSIKDCVSISRAIEGSLDRDVEDFALDVSSPGLDQPFRVLRQYTKNVGKTIKVKHANGDTYVGKLKDVDDVGIKLLITEKKEEREESIPYTDIKETRIVISFN